MPQLLRWLLDEPELPRHTAGVTWEMRLDTCVWLVLTALAAGHTVLIHCRQGKHRSGALAMLIMAILAPVGQELYDTIEAEYFAKNPKVTMSEWDEWWYGSRGERICPDRWRVWQLWRRHSFDEHVQRIRQMPWAHSILQCSMCPGRHTQRQCGCYHYHYCN